VGTERAEGPVVVGYDGSDAARRALTRAAAAAGARGHVVVVHASEAGVDDADEEPSGRGAALAREANDLLAADGVAVSTRLMEGDAAEALVQVAREVDPRLIVIGARGGDFVARTLRGSIGERLVARAPCDLLVVR
jgi:nucleotide-binding universal stress UspA family protein